MTLGSRGPEIGVFAVDDRSAQLTWRRLLRGQLSLVVRGLARQPTEQIEVDDGPGSAVIEDLPAGRLLRVQARGSAFGDDQTRELSLRTLDRLPGEELCRVATLSDLHLGIRAFGQRGTIVEQPTPDIPHARRCSQAALDEAVAWGAERVIVKGDITNAGVADHWRQYKAMVDSCPVPVDGLPGNHDNAHPMVLYSLNARVAAEAFDISLAEPLLVRDMPGLRLILVDTTLPGRNVGTVEPVTDDLVDAVADADRAGGVLVALHHQLQSQVVPEGWPRGVSHAESLDLLERLGRAHPHVFVTSGHTHRHRRWGHAGVVATQVGSTKDFPGVWAGYTVHEGGMSQVVHRVARPDCLAWTDHTRRAALGLWGHIAIGRMDARCFNVPWTVPG